MRVFFVPDAFWKISKKNYLRVLREDFKCPIIKEKTFYIRQVVY